jgi:CheY-like chemotaxis protein
MGQRERKLTGAARALSDAGGEQLGRILVVEADPDTQWRLARMLTLHGHRVVGTSSGDGAFALVAEWPVDLVLVDETLPGMPGLEVARRLREQYPSIRVVLMTGSEGPEVRLAARLAGVVACLVKPFQIETFRDLVAGLFMAPLPEPAPG